MQNTIDFSKIIERKEELAFYKNLSVELPRFLKNNGPVNFDWIVRYFGGSDRRMIRLVDQMVKTKTIHFKNDYFYVLGITSRYKKTIYSKNILCRECSGKFVDKKNNNFKNLKSFVSKIYKKRPVPTFIFDQRPVTKVSTISRALFSLWRGDLQGKAIALIGDDDFTCIPLAYLGVTKKITVFEIDKRICSYIKTIIRDNRKFIKTPIEVVNTNIFDGIPLKYKHKFDVFMADPTPNIKPFSIFTNIGLELLKKGTGKIGYISIYPSHSTTSIEFQKFLTKQGLIMTDIIPFFVEYERIPDLFKKEDMILMKRYSAGNQTPSFFESMIRVESTGIMNARNTKTKLGGLLGKATQRVLENLDNDPAVRRGDGADYIKKQAKMIIKRKNKRINI